MTVVLGDCVEVMAGMESESIDAIVCDSPYGLEFMGKEWDSLQKPVPDATSDAPTYRHERNRLWSGGKGDWKVRPKGGKSPFQGNSGPTYVAGRPMQDWHHAWATAALRVAKPGAYLLAFGGTRTYHRLACAIEDAGWIIRDTLVWAYAQGFPKGRANLKPAWEPIVMARKPGPLRMLAIDECRPTLMPRSNRPTSCAISCAS